MGRRNIHTGGMANSLSNFRVLLDNEHRTV
jgi:hypothetical protein